LPPPPRPRPHLPFPRRTLLRLEVTPPLARAWLTEEALPLLPPYINHQGPLLRALLLQLSAAMIVNAAGYRLRGPPFSRCYSRCCSLPFPPPLPLPLPLRLPPPLDLPLPPPLPLPLLPLLPLPLRPLSAVLYLHPLPVVALRVSAASSLSRILASAFSPAWFFV